MVSLVFVAASSSHWRDRKDKQKSSILHCKCNCECCSEGFLEALPTEWSGKYDELALRCAISGLASLQLTSPMLELGLTSYGLTGLLQRQGTRNSAGLEASLHWWLHTELPCGSRPARNVWGRGVGKWTTQWATGACRDTQWWEHVRWYQINIILSAWDFICSYVSPCTDFLRLEFWRVMLTFPARKIWSTNYCNGNIARRGISLCHGFKVSKWSGMMWKPPRNPPSLRKLKET